MRERNRAPPFLVCFVAVEIDRDDLVGVFFVLDDWGRFVAVDVAMNDVGVFYLDDWGVVGGGVCGRWRRGIRFWLGLMKYVNFVRNQMT
jgi:hypothetical protein